MRVKAILIAIGLCLLAVIAMKAQPTPEAGQVELFCGADLYYGDTNMRRLYDVFIDLTPGVKWHLGNDWMVAGQLGYAAVNYGYDNKYNYFGSTGFSVS